MGDIDRDRLNDIGRDILRDILRDIESKRPVKYSAKDEPVLLRDILPEIMSKVRMQVAARKTIISREIKEINQRGLAKPAIQSDRRQLRSRTKPGLAKSGVQRDHG